MSALVKWKGLWESAGQFTLEIKIVSEFYLLFPTCITTAIHSASTNVFSVPDDVLNPHASKMWMGYTCIFKFVFQEPLFAARVVYDLLFFFIVIIIVLNLIFGVIIDTFADLRSEKQKKEEILKTTCFICGKCSPDGQLINE